MTVRTLYSGYVKAAEAYFAELIPRLVNYQYQNGGPIIAVQAENEYGTYGSDKNYLSWVKNLLTKNGIIELLFTCDPPEALENGTLPGLFTVVNFGAGFGGDTASQDALKLLRQFQPNRPLMVGEFWSGWFDIWGAQHHVWKPESFQKQLEAVLKMNASINFYMFHGGTNFGFMNGALRFYEKNSDKLLYTSIVSSYDYDSPLSEAGWITEKYLIVRELLKQHNPDFPADPILDNLIETSNFENHVARSSIHVVPQMYMNLTTALKLIKAKPSEILKTMEHFGQHFGFIAYRTLLPSAGTLDFNVVFGDRLLVILNGKTVRTFEHQGKFEFDKTRFSISVPLPEKGSSNDLILFVENMGRVSYEPAPHILQGETKGLNGTVRFNAEIITAWNVYNMEFDQKFMQAFLSANQWAKIANASSMSQNQPVFYKARLNFTSKDIKDYFVCSQLWLKGVAFINNETLGRYWSAGPQKTLYLPKPTLGIQNTLIMFELEYPGDSVALMDFPDLGPHCEMPCFPWSS